MTVRPIHSASQLRPIATITTFATTQLTAIIHIRRRCRFSRAVRWRGFFAGLLAVFADDERLPPEPVEALSDSEGLASCALGARLRARSSARLRARSLLMACRLEGRDPVPEQDLPGVTRLLGVELGSREPAVLDGRNERRVVYGPT